MKPTPRTSGPSVNPATNVGTPHLPVSLLKPTTGNLPREKEDQGQQDPEQESFFRAWCCACEGYGSIF
jgi:hypothetical protein